MYDVSRPSAEALRLKCKSLELLQRTSGRRCRDGGIDCGISGVGDGGSNSGGNNGDRDSTVLYTSNVSLFPTLMSL